MNTTPTTPPIPDALTIQRARDGGFVVQTGYDMRNDTRSVSAFAGSLADCLGYLAATFTGQDPAAAVAIMGAGPLTRYGEAQLRAAKEAAWQVENGDQLRAGCDASTDPAWGRVERVPGRAINYGAREAIALGMDADAVAYYGQRYPNGIGR